MRCLIHINGDGICHAPQALANKHRRYNNKHETRALERRSHSTAGHKKPPPVYAASTKKWCASIHMSGHAERPDRHASVPLLWYQTLTRVTIATSISLKQQKGRWCCMTVQSELPGSFDKDGNGHQTSSAKPSTTDSHTCWCNLTVILVFLVEEGGGGGGLHNTRSLFGEYFSLMSVPVFSACQGQSPQAIHECRNVGEADFQMQSLS